MKCIHCRAEWKATNSKSTNCPFCGKSLVAEVEINENMPTEQILQRIVEKFGRDVFKDSRRLANILSDWMTHDRKTLKLLKIAIDNRVPIRLLEIETFGRREKEIELRKLKQDLMETCFLQEKAAGYAVDCFVEALGSKSGSFFKEKRDLLTEEQQFVFQVKNLSIQLPNAKKDKEYFFVFNKESIGLPDIKDFGFGNFPEGMTYSMEKGGISGIPKVVGDHKMFLRCVHKQGYTVDKEILFVVLPDHKVTFDTVDYFEEVTSSSKVRILTDTGATVEAQAPIIISASRSTDIPAFYAQWFINRLKSGYCVWCNPFNQQPMYVSFKNTKVVVFWSKNPKPIIPYLNELDKRGMHYYFQFTLNDYERKGFEPNVPPLNERIETFKALSAQIGKKKVIWRFDPLVMTDQINVDELLKRVEKIGNQLNGYTEKLVFSFADIGNFYKKVENNLNV